MAVTKTLKDNVTGKTYTFNFEKEPTEQDLNDAVAYVQSAVEKQPEQATTKQPEQPQKQGLGDKYYEGVVSATKAGAERIAARTERAASPSTALGNAVYQKTGSNTLGSIAAGPEKALRYVGGAAANVADIGYTAVDALSGGTLSSLMGMVGKVPGVSNIAQAAEKLKEAHPEAYKNLASVIDLSGAKVAKPAANLARGEIQTIASEMTKETPKIKKAAQNIYEKMPAIFRDERGEINLSKTIVPDIDELAKIEEYNIGKSTNQILNKKQVKAQAGEAPKTGFASGIDEGEAQVLNVPKSETSAPFTDYAIQAKKALRRVDENGNAVDTPMDLVGKRGAEAFRQVKQIRQEIGSQKADYLEKIDDSVIANNDFVLPSAIKDTWQRELRSKLGIYINENGTVKASAEGFKNEALIPEVKKINAMISRLPNEMTAEQLDSFSSNLNGFLTKRKQSQFNAKADQVDIAVGRLKDVINNEIEAKASTLLNKTDFDNYLNAKRNYGNMVRIEGELSSSLGREVVPNTDVPSRGAAIMKRAVQSNADAGSKALFRAVKDITGVDLIQEANYADIAMRAVGDPRMNNLLESVGLLKNVAMSPTLAGKTVKVGEAAFDKIRGNKLDRLIDYYNKAQIKKGK
jgi:flagellar hook-basal body complex protein FliE